MKNYLYTDVFAKSGMLATDGMIYCYLVNLALSQLDDDRSAALRNAKELGYRLPVSFSRAEVAVGARVSATTLWRSLDILKRRRLYADGVVDMSKVVGSKFFPAYDLEDDLSANAYVLYCFLRYKSKTDRALNCDYVDMSVTQMARGTGLKVTTIPQFLMKLAQCGYTRRDKGRLIILR